MLDFDFGSGLDSVTRQLAQTREWLRCYIEPPGDCFVILSVDGTYWSGAGWVENREEARQYAGPVPVVAAPAPATVGPLLMDIKKAAQLLAVSPRTVGKLVAEGALGSVKVAGARRISRKHIDDYLARQEATRPAPAAPEPAAPRPAMNPLPRFTGPNVFD
jgi:excisionase family DNA binding protein